MNLRTRLAVAGGAVVFSTLAVVSGVIYALMVDRIDAQIDAALVDDAGVAPATVEQIEQKLASIADKDPKRAAESLTRPLNFGSGLLQLVSKPGEPGAGDELAPVDDHDLAVAAGTAPPYYRELYYQGERYRVYTTLLSAKAGGPLVRVARPLTDRDATLTGLWALLVSLTAAGTACATLAARLAASRVLLPVRQLTDAVEEMSQTQQLTAEIPAGGPDEIGRLARTFAGTMTALDRSVQAQRHLVADASHELRTPLTSLTTNLELLHEDGGTADPQAPALIRSALQQAGELTALVNDLVELSRTGSVEPHTEDARLDLLADRVVRRAAARGADVWFETDLHESQVHVDPDAVERAIGNLVDNAIKWSPPRGRILVTAAAGEVAVSDQGPGIAAEDLPHVFDRFYRAPAARALPGSGLGLAIVRQIAETHDGRVGAEPLERGVRMWMRFPPAAAPDLPSCTDA